MNEKLIKGDCLEEMGKLAEHSVNLVIADLPYGITRNFWDCPIPLSPMWESLNKICDPCCNYLFFGSGMFTADLMESKKRWWRYNLIWQKTQPSGFLNAKRMPMRTHEDIIVFYKYKGVYNPIKTFGNERKTAYRKDSSLYPDNTNYGYYKESRYDSTERYPTSIFKFKKDVQTSHLHPTQKPVALLSYLIKMYSNEHDVVLDFVMGSGSTGVACQNTNRRFIGIEKDEKYFSVAKERIEANGKEQDL